MEASLMTPDSLKQPGLAHTLREFSGRSAFCEVFVCTG